MSNLAASFFVWCLLISSSLTAADSSPRQYYSSWHKHPKQSYYYRHYYYKPSPKYAGYKHHYVVYSPKRPKHLYYYNPYSRKYWGRCPSQLAGEPLYSLLAEKDRKPQLSEIPEASFPVPIAPPSIPEAEDGVPLDLPPDDLPGEFSATAGPVES